MDAPAKNLADICYKRNFLTSVIFRIDFVTPVEAIAAGLPAALEGNILKLFPIPEPKKQKQQEIQIGHPGPAVAREIEKIEWNFHSADRTRTIAITPECFWMSCSSYKSYAAFRDNLAQATGFLFQAYPDIKIKRTGLRYINDVRDVAETPIQWKGIIDDTLLCTLSFSLDGGEFARVFHNVEFAFERHNLRFLFGIHNQHYPAPVRERSFILDYDAYRQGFNEPSDLLGLVDTLHSCIQGAFEKSITKGLRENLDA